MPSPTKLYVTVGDVFGRLDAFDGITQAMADDRDYLEGVWDNARKNKPEWPKAMPVPFSLGYAKGYADTKAKLEQAAR